MEYGAAALNSVVHMLQFEMLKGEHQAQRFKLCAGSRS